MRALAFSPGSPDARIALGKYQLEVRRDAEAALRELVAAQKDKPNDAELLATVAEAQWDLRADTSAVAIQAGALALDPRSVTKTLALAEMHEYLRRYDDAARLYDQAIQLDSTSPGPYIAKARLHLLRDGDLARARAVVREAARRVDSMTLVKTAVTNEATWLALGMLDESYQRALLTLPVDAFTMPAWHAMVNGYTYRALGDSARARAYYDTALVAARAGRRDRPPMGYGSNQLAERGAGTQGLGVRAHAQGPGRGGFPTSPRGRRRVHGSALRLRRGLRCGRCRADEGGPPPR